MTSWPNSVYRHPPTSTPGQFSRDARCTRAATSSSPPPSGRRRSGNIWSGFSPTQKQVAGMTRWNQRVLSELINSMLVLNGAERKVMNCCFTLNWEHCLAHWFSSHWLMDKIFFKSQIYVLETINFTHNESWCCFLWPVILFCQTLFLLAGLNTEPFMFRHIQVIVVSVKHRHTLLSRSLTLLIVLFCDRELTEDKPRIRCWSSFLGYPQVVTHIYVHGADGLQNQDRTGG